MALDPAAGEMELRKTARCQTAEGLDLRWMPQSLAAEGPLRTYMNPRAGTDIDSGAVAGMDSRTEVGK